MGLQGLNQLGHVAVSAQGAEVLRGVAQRAGGEQVTTAGRPPALLALG